MCSGVDPTFTEEEEQLKKEKDKETTTAASTGEVKEKGENQESRTGAVASKEGESEVVLLAERE